jgi:hypothetical protein
MDDFEHAIEVVVACAARAARRVDSPAAEPSPLPTMETPSAGSPADVLRSALTLESDELALVWSAVARAVEPAITAHAVPLFGMSPGVSIAQHIAWHELPTTRRRALLEVLDPRHRLRMCGVLLPLDPEPHDVNTRWTTPPRVISYLRGAGGIDPDIEAVGGRVWPPTPMRHSDEQRHVIAKLRTWISSAGEAIIVIDGALGSGRRTAISCAAGFRPGIAVDFARVTPRRAESLVKALGREALLLDAIPVLANLDELWSRLQPGDEIALALANAIDQLAGLIVITTSTPSVALMAVRHVMLRARWPLPDPVTRHQLWTDALKDVGAEAELDIVADRYALGAGGIIAAARSSEHHAKLRGATRLVLADITAGINDNIAERLGELARRVEVKQDWSELVLPPDTLDEVRGLIGRVRHGHFVLDGWGFRKKLALGAGIAALFSGPPGTGKTMVAGLIARELQLELYQVDLSRIVSKWVGETEKQLAKVFEAAEAGHALLLFDEADALFAKRSAEVKSAVDRYANLEVNYLLQRVESFGGMVILTTNLDTSIDPALRRRLASHIVFTTPDTEERVKLWREMLATGAPLDGDLDLRSLAEEFREMTGANIRNAVLAAAFLAAAENQTISTTHLRRAARGEYRAMGHMLTRDDRAGRRL